MDSEAAVVGAGDAAVGDEGGGAAQALAVEELERLEHFAHARAAFGAFIADDDHLTSVDAACFQSSKAILLRIEADSRPAEITIFCGDCGGFGDAAFRRQIAIEDSEAASGLVRSVERANERIIGRIKETIVL